ncbi:DUF305 domain-containing protein [soil metagenome]
MKYTFVLLLGYLLIGCGGPTGTDDHAGHDHSTMDHASMDHSKMQSSPDAAAAPLELQFLDTMILHHQGAIDMAKLGDTNAGRPEMKQFTQAIIAEQDREITQMKRWRDEWHKDVQPAVNMAFPGMASGMEGMDGVKLSALSGNEFDVEFARQMILHHEGAVAMSNHLLESNGGDAPRKELKLLAEAIVKDQSREIEQMKKWLAEWK